MSKQLPAALRGVGVAPVTPFTADLSAVDRAALADNIAFLIENGVSLIYVAGNTGESASLSPQEWTTVVETAMEAAGEAVVVAGIGHQYPVALELAARAKSLAVSGVLTMPRMQPCTASSVLVRYWLEIIEAAGIPAVVYKRGLPDEADLTRLLDHELVVGCKYADRDLSAFASVVAEARTGTLCTCGPAERYAPFFHTAGAVGFTSGLANFAPHIALSLHRALVAGDSVQATGLRDEYIPIEEIRARNGESHNVAA